MFGKMMIQKIKEVIKENEKQLIFFKGIPASLVKEASQEAYMDIDLDSLSKEGIQEAIQQGKHIGLFEHAIVGQIKDPKIIRNNLYDQDYIYMKEDEYSNHIYELLNNEEDDSLYNLYVHIEKIDDYYKVYYNSFLPCLDLFESKESITNSNVRVKPIYFHSYQYDTYLISLLEGNKKSVYIICKNEEEMAKATLFLSYLPASIKYKLELESRDQVITQSVKEITNHNVDIKHIQNLKKYWGEDAGFRMLKFYSDPQSKNITEISQGQLITKIGESIDACQAKKPYQDIFITAPTGSGKSILFQLPAVYTHETYQAVTIIVTPLIALMKDQVDAANDRGLGIATYINSMIDFAERQRRIESIINGEKSLLYIAPELLVNTPLEHFIGNRKIGLMVIDEAHTVTSWGKDFRIDYWFLGDYLTALRQTGNRFPILCLTATAVYGGKEDVVNETIDTLNLVDPCIYLGNVKRENIRYYITSTKHKEIDGSLKEYKLKKVKLFVQRCIIKKEKALIYCPYVVQVNEIYEGLPEKLKTKVGKYHARLSPELRGTMQEDFKKGNLLVMICTKAFGMGIDDANITNIYHYAPTGNLADYVQEIGRAARNPRISGMAKADYIDSDLRYVDTLYSVSGFKHFQLREMIRKILTIYEEKKTKNLLLAPETFNYLFDGENVDGKVKNGLFLIEKDLEKKYGFKMMSVEPQSINRMNYICVPFDAEKDFLSKYKKYCKKCNDDTKYSTNSNGKVTTIRHFGNIFRVNMAKLWESEFTDMTFMDFKRAFFNGELFTLPSKAKPLPMLRFILDYEYEYESVQAQFKEILLTLTKIFDAFHEEGKYFTEETFRETLKENFPSIMEHLDITNMLLDLFTTSSYASLDSLSHGRTVNRTKFIQRRHDSNTNITSFRVCNTNYNNLDYHYSYILTRFVPNHKNAYRSYITYRKEGVVVEELELSSLLELLHLASYQVSGGNNSEVALSLYEVQGLYNLLEQDYINGEVEAIQKRRRASIEILRTFFESEKDSEERWEFVENYFLGKNVD